MKIINCRKIGSGTTYFSQREVGAITILRRNNPSNIMYISEDRRASSKTKMKRVSSSKPLRVSLKDLECVKKLKEKIVK